jgi:hypothetical protein
MHRADNEQEEEKEHYGKQKEQEEIQDKELEDNSEIKMYEEQVRRK